VREWSAFRRQVEANEFIVQVIVEAAALKLLDDATSEA
jgi:hypothetical protein